jgi:hypothetical protein
MSTNCFSEVDSLPPTLVLAGRGDDTPPAMLTVGGIEVRPDYLRQPNTLGDEIEGLGANAREPLTCNREGDMATAVPTGLVAMPARHKAKLPKATLRTGVTGGADHAASSTDDSPTSSSSDAADKAEVSQPADALTGHTILKVGEGTVVPAERYPDKVVVDKFDNDWFGAYDDEDYLMIEGRLADQPEYIASLNGRSELLSDPVLHLYAKRLSIPIKYRIYKDLTEAQSRAFVLESQTEGRPLKPKERRELKHAIVLAYLDVQAGPNKRLTFAAIGRRVGYTEARVRQIKKDRQKHQGRNISDSESSESSAAPSKAGTPAKTAKQKRGVSNASEPAATTPRHVLQVAGSDPVQVAIDHLVIPQEDVAGLVEESNKAGTQRFENLLAGNSGNKREELLLTLKVRLEFQAAADAARRHLEGLLAASKVGVA